MNTKLVVKGVLQAVLIGAIVLLVLMGEQNWAIFFAVLLVLSCT